MFKMIQNLEKNKNQPNKSILGVPVKTRTINNYSIQTTMLASRSSKLHRFSLSGVSNAKIYGGGGCGCGK